jgi:glycosyltransferase involved in cell wall biosynthesis
MAHHPTSMITSRLARLYLKISGGVITLRPKGASRGRVLLSYLTEPFLHPRTVNFESHTNLWECKQIAQTFLDKGFTVDVVDWKNSSFMPKRTYKYVIDIHSNLERWSAVLPSTCIKIFHATGSHWLFQNTAEYTRLLELQQRRGYTLMPRRIVSPTHSVEHADRVTILGNKTTQATYAFAKKPLFPIPLSTTNEFPFPEEKDFAAVQKSFIWFGGGGSVHKGLDLVLELFAQHPEYQLSVCGKIDSDFERAYFRELHELPNITLYGWVHPSGDIFTSLVSKAVALIHPSCSEGQSGAVILGLHASLIPIVTKESGVDVEPFGITLPDASSASLRDAVQSIANAMPETLSARAKEAWQYARTHHTREVFAKSYADFVTTLETESPEKS